MSLGTFGLGTGDFVCTGGGDDMAEMDRFSVGVAVAAVVLVLVVTCFCDVGLT